MTRTIGLGSFLETLSSAAASSDLSAAAGTPVIAIDLSETLPAIDVDAVSAAIQGLTTVLVGIGPPDLHGSNADMAALLDVVLEDPTPVIETVMRYPLASVTAVLVLRATVQLDIASALATESAAYSALQAGPEFARWRAARPRRPATKSDGPTVLLSRRHDILDLTLNRPTKHNAFNTDMRDELTEALLVALTDPSVAGVVLKGAGPSFCSGGDLDEFGTLPDPATAHLTRLARSAGRLMALVADRLEVHLHGACLGAGIELAAFARRVVADPGTVIALPEIDLGLIPGAGGTVSLPRRIGRHRTAELILTRARLDAATAHAWGVIDEVTP